MYDWFDDFTVNICVLFFVIYLIYIEITILSDATVYGYVFCKNIILMVNVYIDIFLFLYFDKRKMFCWHII